MGPLYVDGHNNQLAIGESGRVGSQYVHPSVHPQVRSHMCGHMGSHDMTHTIVGMNVSTGLPWHLPTFSPFAFSWRTSVTINKTVNARMDNINPHHIVLSMDGSVRSKWSMIVRTERLTTAPIALPTTVYSILICITVEIGIVSFWVGQYVISQQSSATSLYITEGYRHVTIWCDRLLPSRHHMV